MPLLLKEGKNPSKLTFRREILLWSFERGKKINAWNEIPAHASGLCVTGEEKLLSNFYCFISLLTLFYFTIIEQSISKKNIHTLYTIMIWLFYLLLLFSYKYTSPAQITNAKLFCFLQSSNLKTMRNSNVRRYRKKDKSNNSLFEISIFTNCSSFLIATVSLPF